MTPLLNKNIMSLQIDSTTPKRIDLPLVFASSSLAWLSYPHAVSSTQSSNGPFVPKAKSPWEKKYQHHPTTPWISQSSTKAPLEFGKQE